MQLLGVFESDLQRHPQIAADAVVQIDEERAPSGKGRGVTRRDRVNHRGRQSVKVSGPLKTLMSVAGPELPKTRETPAFLGL